MAEQVTYMHNYRTGQDDARTTPPETDEETVQYIPQDARSHALYVRHRMRGDTPLAAMMAVLLAHVPDAPAEGE